MSADLTDCKGQCRIDNHGQNVNILSMIVQKRCFCLCLPQALLKGGSRPFPLKVSPCLGN